MKFYTSTHQHKNNILVAGYDENGKRVLDSVPYEPYLFYEDKKGGYDTWDGKKASRRDFNSMYDARQFCDKFAGVMNLYGMAGPSFQYVYLYDEFISQNMQYDRKSIHVVSLDIEVDSENGFPFADTAMSEVTAITISRNGKMALFTTKPFDASKHPHVKHYKCESEFALLSKFLRVWNSEEFAPDIVTGWHIDGFDIPYLINRITRILGAEKAKELSPWGILTTRTVKGLGGREQEYHTIVGVATLDYKQLYDKYLVPVQGRPESYRLDFIAHEELGERKLDYTEYGDLSTLYRENPQLYFEYNIRDVELIDRLDNKLKLIDLAIRIAYDSGVTFNDVMGTVRSWDSRIHTYLRDRNTVIPYSKVTDEDWSVPGGHVKQPIVGMHKDMVSFDLASSYPHQIMMYNIGPETLVDKIRGFTIRRVTGYDHPKDIDDIETYVNMLSELVTPELIVTANGCRYKKHPLGFLAELMKKTFDERTTAKSKQKELENLAEREKDPKIKARLEFEAAEFKNIQEALKVVINSGYGALANAFNRWFNPNLAESITTSGQMAVLWAEKSINEYLNKILGTKDVDYVVYIDTDSAYVTLEKLVDKVFPKRPDDYGVIADFLDKVAKEKISKVIAEGFEDLAKRVGAPQNKLNMKRESIGDIGIWTGPKHYILRVYDKEGVRYEKPKTKITGIEAVRSSTPGAARTAIKDAIDIILDQDESKLHKFVGELRRKYRELPVEDIAFPKGINGLNKWENPKPDMKGRPIHVSGAINHNQLLKERGITAFKPIAEGEKIKYVYLKKHNPYGVHVMAFADIMPPQFELDEYIDRHVQFEKGFLNALTTITDAIEWTPEYKATLAAFFS